MSKTVFDTGFPGTPRVQPVHVEDQPVVVGMYAAQGPVAASGSNAASTTANTDYVFAWTGNQQVNHVILQNNTAAALNYDIDSVASAGSLSLAAGATIFLDVSMLALHLFTAAVEGVNGSASGNIVVRAWL